jgi:IclR family KDG regulon transcriptional repressor
MYANAQVQLEMPRVSTPRTKYSIQSVENALDVLEVISIADGGIGITELAGRLQMNKGMAFRLMATLENRGYVEKAKKNGVYRVGPAAYDTGRKLLLRVELLNKAKPVMEHLCRQCDETVYLAMPRHEQILLLEMVDSAQKISIRPLVGKAYPLADVAFGRVVLAYQERARVLREDVSEKALAGIKRHGVCVETGGLGEGVTCLAVPIFNAQGKVAGSLCIVGPEFRLEEKRLNQDLLPLLKHAGQVVSVKLGHLANLMP